MNQARFARRPLFAQSLLLEADRLADMLQGRYANFPVNVRNTGTALEFHAFLPGVSKDDNAVNVRVEEQILVIEYKAGTAGEPDQGDGNDTSEGWLSEEYRRRDRGERRFQIPDGFDASQITARLKDGVLVVTLPRASISHPQSIAIEG